MIEIRHRKGIADALIQKQSHKRDRDRLKRNRKRDPKRFYKERRDVIRTLFNANLNEISQSVKRLKEWLPIGELLLKNWTIEEFLSRLQKVADRSRIIPEDFLFDITENDLNKLQEGFRETYQDLYDSDITIVEETHAESVMRCQAYDYPTYQCYRALLLGEPEGITFNSKSFYIKLWKSRKKGKDMKIRGLTSWGDICLFDIVRGHEKEMRFTGKCTKIEENGIITIKSDYFEKRFHSDDVTLIKRDTGWDYLQLTQHNVYETLHKKR